jgi:hypothetical protein
MHFKQNLKKEREKERGYEPRPKKLGSSAQPKCKKA